MRKFLSIFALSLLCLTAKANDEDPLRFTSASGNTSVKIGGFVNFTASTYLDGSTTSGYDFTVSKIPTETGVYDESSLGYDATGTRMYLDFTQTTEALGDVKFYIEGDFRGASDNWRIRHAHVKFKGFTFGQDWTLMMDLPALTPILDLQHTPSRVYFRTPQIAYKYNITDKLSLSVSAEKPVFSATASDELLQASTKVPDFLFALHHVGSKGHIKFSGVWRTMSYSDYLNDSVETLNGWGLQLSGKIAVAPALTLYGQAIYGDGVARYICDLGAIGGYDILESSVEEGQMATPTAYGGYVGFKYDFASKWAFVGCYSEAHVDELEGYTVDSSYEKGDYASATLYYYPGRNLTLGLEYLYGCRHNFSGEAGTASRLGLTARYFF